jgi:hypothetical protein
MTDTLTTYQKAGRKAWETRRARAAAAALAASTAIPAPAAPVVETPRPAAVVHRESDADLVHSVYVAPEMIPADDFQMIEIWLDHPVVGCGRRRFVVMASSSKRVRLFNPARLVTIEISREEFDRAHIPARKVDRKLLARLMSENIALADRVNTEKQADVLSDGGADAVRVLEWLS